MSEQKDNRPASTANSDATTIAMPNNSVSPANPDKLHTESNVASAAPSDRAVSPDAQLQNAEKPAPASTHDETDEEDDHEYPKAWKLGVITIALCLSVFCMALDNTIIATAIPRITDQFKALDDVGWYGSSYLLTTCATQLIYGKFYTFYSIKWVYISALFIFELGSLICGVAPNSEALIIGRAIAGVGSAGIFSGAILIIASAVPLRQRPTYMGLIGGMYGIASVAGPLLGGVFTDRLTWRWCFYINLPFGAVTAAFIIPFFDIKRKGAKQQATWKEQVAKFDLYGTALFLPAIICLLLALQWGGTTYAWNNGRIIALLVLFAILTAGFIGVQIWRQENATVPPRVFLNRNVWGSALFISMLGAAFFVVVYYLPLWFQAIKGASATKSGIMNLPAILGLVIVSMIGGAAVTAIGYYTPFMLTSSILMSVGAGLLTTFTTSTHHSEWIGYQFIFGAGVGFGMQQPLVAVQTVLPKNDIPIGTAIIMFSQTLGGALFISVGQNVFSNQLVRNLQAVVPDLDPRIVTLTGATAIKEVVEERFLKGVLIAYNDALTQTLYVSVATACLSLVGAAFVQWKSMKGKDIQMGAA